MNAKRTNGCSGILHWGRHQLGDRVITWFPTHTNTVIAPTDAMDGSQTGTVTLDLSSAPLGGHVNNYIDTLHTDFAFIITPEPFVKSMETISETAAEPNLWDFSIYPNPAQDAVSLGFTDASPKEVMLFDLAGRAILTQENVTALVTWVSLDRLARGIYWVRVQNGIHVKTKKLIIR